MPSQIILGVLNLAFMHACIPHFHLDNGAKKDCLIHNIQIPRKSGPCSAWENTGGLKVHSSGAGRTWVSEPWWLSPAQALPRQSGSDKPETGPPLAPSRIQPTGQGAALPCHRHDAPDGPVLRGYRADFSSPGPGEAWQSQWFPSLQGQTALTGVTPGDGPVLAWHWSLPRENQFASEMNRTDGIEMSIHQEILDNHFKILMTQQTV